MNFYEFPVALEPISRILSNDAIPGKKAVVRTDTGEVLSVVSDKYHLISHKNFIDHVVPEMTKFMPGFQEQVLLDRNGCVLNYILTYKSADYKMKAVGEDVGFRVHIRNSYDGLSSANVRVGALVLSCKNGMVIPKTKINIGVIHKNGFLDKIKLPKISDLEGLFLSSIDKWDEMGSKPFKEESFEHSVKKLILDGIVNERNKGEIVGRSCPKTYWDFMQRVTAHITHGRTRITNDRKVALTAKATGWLENNYNNLTIN